MAAFFAGRACQLRPHFKSHKCLAIARLQLAAGQAVGMTCAKLSEAEVLVAGGVRDVLIANQVVGRGKVQRLAELNRNARVRVAVDAEAQAAALAAAASAAGTIVGVLVEVDIGMRRCGVSPGRAVLELARVIQDSPALELDGLQGYEGHLVMLPDPQERRRKTEQAIRLLLEQRDLLRQNGLACPIVSGGSSSTYDVTGAIEGVCEVQAGSYALMDAAYHRLRPEFHRAMFILATVISSTGSQAVVDVGLKGMGNDFGLPEVAKPEGASVRYVAEEHTVIDGLSVPIGSLLQLVPTHGCTTANLHRRIWVVRDGMVQDVWPIEGSGCLE
jgi:D-serine deaminase-like pyridoxal phosphate-dependent protein